MIREVSPQGDRMFTGGSLIPKEKLAKR